MNKNAEKSGVINKMYVGLSTEGAVRLGDTIKELLTQSLAQKQAKYATIYIAWQKILPSDLLKHCKIYDFKHGCLMVAVDLPVYMNELQLHKPDLLDFLQDHCKGTRVKDIRFSVGR